MAKGKVIYKGKKWEVEGMPCFICGTIMSELYREEEGFANPHNYEDYGPNKCHNCGQEYHYDEGDMILLSKEQLALLRKHAGDPKPDKNQTESSE